MVSDTRSSTASRELQIAVPSSASDFDGGGVSYRIGLIALATAEAAERDFRAMLPPDAQFYTSRLLNTNPVTIESLRAHRSKLALAAEQLLPGARLDVIYYDCTSGTVANGYELIAAEIHRSRPDVPVVTPITAAVNALRHLGTTRISMLTPYPRDVNAAMVEYLRDRDIDVLRLASFMLDDDLRMAKLSPGAIRRAAVQNCDPAADALFISCTAIRAVEVLDEIESELGIPVISSIQAACWECLRTAGYDRPLDGYGKLLRS